tara:strand:+ start:142 stop:651 length:510 start_codon:yes stop_codon:yes gene_type:complete
VEEEDVINNPDTKENFWLDIKNVNNSEYYKAFKSTYTSLRSYLGHGTDTCIKIKKWRNNANLIPPKTNEFKKFKKDLPEPAAEEDDFKAEIEDLKGQELSWPNRTDADLGDRKMLFNLIPKLNKVDWTVRALSKTLKKIASRNSIESESDGEQKSVAKLWGIFEAQLLL